MLITKFIEIDMGHRIPNHKSKCKNIHGHRYHIEVGVDDKIISTSGTCDEGMVIDYGDLKQIMVKEIDVRYDHGFMMYRQDEFMKAFNIFKDKYNQKIIFVDFIPTAENISKHWFELIKPRLRKKGIMLEYVKVLETPTSSATYTSSNYEADKSK